MRKWLLALLLLPAACASQPDLVMINPSTGATVGCGMPDFSGGSGEFLVSYECLSACQAHGFQLDPNGHAAASGSLVPRACVN